MCGGWAEPVANGSGLTDWAQVASALFAAVAAGAAWWTVFRAERDRREAAYPDLHVELLGDRPKDEMRLTVVNLGGPGREVKVMGTVGEYGFYSLTSPSTYWQPGERRVWLLAMPVVDAPSANVVVESRDMRKQWLFATTFGGAYYRWPLRKAKKRSAESTWRELFPGQPGPLEVPKTPVDLELVERTV
jgi:hypothetical protein